MQRTTLTLALIAALTGGAAPLSPTLANPVVVVPPSGGLVTPQPPLTEALAKKIADTLRARSASQRSAFYQDLRNRGDNIRFPDIDVVLELPSPVRVGGGAGAEAELDLHVPAGTASTTPFAVFAAPEGEDETLFGAQSLAGFDLGTGARITRTRAQLEQGTQAFLVVDAEGQLALKRFIRETNASLAAVGLGGSRAAVQAAAHDASRGSAKNLPGGPGPGIRYTSRLHSIRADQADGEWHSKAEIYALVSCFDSDGHPQVTLAEMPFFEKRHHTYMPDWTEFFQWAWEPAEGYTEWYISSTCGLLFMERDRGDWSAAVLAGLAGVEQVADAAGAPMVAEIASALNGVAAALAEQGLFTNKDDYLDTVYTIEAFRPDGENKKHGVNGNIHVHFIDETWGWHSGEVHPDLAFNALVTQNGSFRPGQDIHVALSVRNLGYAQVDPWTVDFLLVPAGGGTPFKLATGQGPAVAAQANWAHAFALKIPAGLKKIPPGHYRLEARLHAPDDADAGNDHTQAIHSQIKILPAHAGDYTLGQAELIPHYLATVAGSYHTTDTVPTLFEVRNTGGVSGGFEAHFWAQHQTSGELRYLAKGSTGTLLSGGSYATSIDVPLSGLGMGQWRMWMQVAATDGEQSTANNIKTAMGTFTVAAGGVVTPGS